MSMKLVYLASPYIHDDPEIMKYRVVATSEALLLGLRNQKYMIYSPIVYMYPLSPYLPDDYNYMKSDLFMLEKSNELWVLMLEGWEESKGVMKEIRIAKIRRIPIYYIAPR